ncbi:retrovirus-related pol polyprotein from transposon TNT 1-94 [Tanacetum coccineum]
MINDEDHESSYTGRGWKSAYNIDDKNLLEEMYDCGHMFIIDVSQSVDLDHPHALDFLREDCLQHEGAGLSNLGAVFDDVVPETDEVVVDTKKIIDSKKREEAANTNKENTAEVEENDLEMEEMTLEEYEKELEEKRKVLVTGVSKEKRNDRLRWTRGADKDKKKEAVDKEEKGEEGSNCDSANKADLNLNKTRKQGTSSAEYVGFTKAMATKNGYDLDTNQEHFPSYEAPQARRLGDSFSELGVLRESLDFSEESVEKSLGEESANESGSEFIPCFDSSFIEFIQEESVKYYEEPVFCVVLLSNWFPLTRVKWLPLIANSLAVSRIVIAEPRVGATTRSAAHMGSSSIG